MFKHMIGLVMIFGLLLHPAAHAASVELAIGGWQQVPGGELGYKAIDDSDLIKLDDHLGFETENRMMGRINIKTPFGLPNLYLMAAPMEFEGSGSKTIDFTFGDTVYRAGADIDAKLNFNQYDLALYWGIPGIRTASAGKFNLDLGLNARLIDFDAEISGESADVPGEQIHEQESLTLIVPMLYLAAQLMPTDKFSIEAEARGIAYAGNSFISWIGRLRYQFAGPAFIAGGFRMDTLDIDHDDVQVDVSFSGPFVELGLRF